MSERRLSAFGGVRIEEQDGRIEVWFSADGAAVSVSGSPPMQIIRYSDGHRTTQVRGERMFEAIRKAIDEAIERERRAAGRAE